MLLCLFILDWDSLTVGRKFSVFALFTLYLRAVSKYKPPGAHIWRGDLTDVFLHYKFGGLILKRRGLFSEFYSNFHKTPVLKKV